MTRYLDRAPRVYDRVRVEYEGTVNHFGTGGTYPVIHSDSGLICQAPMSAVRVIAPEPKVGDVVTADMGLPANSIIEQLSTIDGEHSSITAKRGLSGEWWQGQEWTSLRQLTAYANPWRIVRIGGTP